ncbi:MAG: small, acid-soluble spore protein, H family [Bacillota bacterium]|nr:small, acid-soluble spore protein, H family [Bacillota bacterium]
MDIYRAEAILKSMGVVGVSYEGRSVWIESLEGDKAVVQCLSSGFRQEVPLRDLVEG